MTVPERSLQTSHATNEKILFSYFIWEKPLSTARQRCVATDSAQIERDYESINIHKMLSQAHTFIFCFHRHRPKNFMKSEKFSPVNFPFPLNSCQSKFPLDSGESVIPSAQSKNIIPKHRNAIQTGNFLHIHSGKWLTTSASECRADSMVWQAAADELGSFARVNNPFHHDVMWWDMKNGSEVSAMSLQGSSNKSQIQAICS